MKEVRLFEECSKWKKARDLFFQQRSKVQWLTQGDQNTKFFHGILKARRNSNRIFHIKDMNGNYIDDPVQIPDAFIDLYTKMLGRKIEDRTHVNSQLIKQGPTVREEQSNEVEAEFTSAKVKQALWAIAGDKAPGPDGFGSQFYKDCWDIVGNDVISGVLEFFRASRMLRIVNSIVITLIPKSTHADAVSDYRPIVYDVLFFCKGEWKSVELILLGLKIFSQASGLNTNATKSNIYSMNMEEQCLKDICKFTGYQRGTLPFRYLGVPISSKKLSATDCEMLVEKLANKVRTWGTRNPSYAGRVLLVNAVLMQVLKNITTICRSFLWEGKENSIKISLVAWDMVCRPKRQGGLGITDCLIWNEAAMVNYVWNIANKEDNLWDKFVDGFVNNGRLTQGGKYSMRSGYHWCKGDVEEMPTNDAGMDAERDNKTRPKWDMEKINKRNQWEEM
ncbi:uncharacterized protein LOC142175800 [Nicotiana tabacum]|uniref:Uncharacterized protein LOC142175800 n=1 Tax=Nicotiana tabacum TaxID=4097 RepID=A0AC58TNT8_TOBAC